MRRAFLLLLCGLGACAAVAAACSDDGGPPPDDGAGGTGGAGGEPDGGPPPITHPIFDGLARAEPDVVDANSVILHWQAAIDDTTPPDQLEYTVLVWQDRPDGTIQERPYPAGPGALRYRYTGLPAEDVMWFAVEVEDLDGERIGRDVVVPAVRPTVAPTLQAPEPGSAAVGDTVQIRGEHLLDEPMLDGALTIGGQPVPASSIVSWSGLLVTLTVPAGAVSGALEVKTPYGTARSTAELTVP